jgi:VWFA-related protein
MDMTALLLSLALAFAQEKPGAAEKQSVQERVTVNRVIVTGRVLDRLGNPILGLTAGDFRLRVDGRETPIETVEWIAGGRLPEEKSVPPEVPAAAAEPAPPLPPHLTVLLFQWEIAGQKDVGFVRMMRQAKRFLDSTAPGERIAVLGYGSNLRLLQDFTADRKAVEEAIRNIRSSGWKGRIERSGGPALSDALEGCGRTDSIEKALLCIGTALGELRGPKTMLFFGWTAATTKETWRDEYPAILEAIGRAETSVSVLDISDGRRVTTKPVLPQSLKDLASDTGGLYNETYDFPDLARRRVERSLEGYYEIVFRDLAIRRGLHEVQIELVVRAGTPLFHRWYQN